MILVVMVIIDRLGLLFQQLAYVDLLNSKNKFAMNQRKVTVSRSCLFKRFRQEGSSDQAKFL